MAAESGQLQLNVFEPIIAFRLMRNLTTLIAGSRILREKCVVGITANAEKMRLQVEQSIGVITALVPALGYEVAERIAGEAARTGRGVYELVIAEGLMEKGQLDALLSPAAMTGEG
jgi:aspartate ammonia-lyase